MSSSSRKYVCPFCFRTARTTTKDIILVCGYCNMMMKYVPRRDYLVERSSQDVLGEGVKR